MQYLLALDSGTTSTRATLFDTAGHRLISASRPLTTSYPQPGYVDQDPMEIFVGAVDSISEVLLRTGINPRDIIGLGITNQRETTLLFDRETGQALSEAIVWQSNETADLAKSYQPYADLIHSKTGLTISPYFSCSKIRYLLDKYDLQSKAEQGRVAFATIDTWLIYKLTNGKSFCTDPTNASRTGLYNIFTCNYDKELLKIYNIPLAMLPPVRSSTSFFGTVKSFPQGEFKILGVAGDQQTSLLGHRLYRPGQIKLTYGTGLFALLNIGDQALLSSSGLLTTIGLSYRDQVSYALEGSVFIGGAAIQWLRDQLELIKTADESEYCARRSVDRSVVVVPAFSGLGTPYWDSRCRGAIFGLTRGSTKDDIVKATLESIAFAANDVILTMEKEAKTKITALDVDGGAAENNYLLQFQSDITNCQVRRPEMIEMTSLGAAFLVGLSSGLYPSLESLDQLDLKLNSFKPELAQAERKDRVSRYQKAIQAARFFE